MVPNRFGLFVDPPDRGWFGVVLFSSPLFQEIGFQKQKSCGFDGGALFLEAPVCSSYGQWCVPCLPATSLIGLPCIVLVPPFEQDPFIPFGKGSCVGCGSLSPNLVVAVGQRWLMCLALVLLFCFPGSGF